MKKIVITYGTFDMFHIGHLELLKRIRGMADELIVAVSTDEFNQIKGKKTIIPFEQRAKIVESIRYVDRVIAEESWDQKRDDIKKYGVTHFVMGDDWRGKFDDLRELCEVIYLPRTKGISSSELKDTIKALSAIDLNELDHAIKILKRIKENLE
jgi:glycerol-3-phosphate cytidylyltransferase